ncbi:Mov34/MPN/PAD-1 family protein [Paenibacillus sp. 843]
MTFTPEVVKIFLSYRQVKKEQPESGGILLGRIYGDGRIVIDQITTPSNEDRSGRHFFDRNVERAQRIVKEAWKQSCGEVRYLGEWHTHPEANPIPSLTDRKLIIGMMEDSILDHKFLFMVIIGLRDNYVGVSCRGEKHITQLLPF